MKSGRNDHPWAHADSFLLHPGQVQSLPVHRGWQVQVESGLFWLTLDQAAGDVLLAPGRVHVLPASGLLVMEVLSAEPGKLMLARSPQLARSGNLMQHLQSIWQSLSALSLFAKGHSSHADARFSGQNAGFYFPAPHDLP